MEGLDLILLNIGHSTHHGDWNWESISSPFTRLFYIETGRAKIHLPNSTQELVPNRLYMIPPFTLHSYECKYDFSHYYIHIYENPTDKSCTLEEFNFPVEVIAKDMDFQLIKRLLEINPNRELQQYDPRLYDNQANLLKNIAIEKSQTEYISIETKGILFQLISRFIRYATPKNEVQDERIRKALKYIRKNLENSLNISQIAFSCGLSNDHFIRLFKKEMNCTPIRFINQKKIEKAQLMLVTDTIPIKEVALSLAFENFSYFNKVFKETTGYTPTQYQSMLLKR